MDWTNYPCDKCVEGIQTCKDCIDYGNCNHINQCIDYGNCNHINQCICCKCEECELWEFEQTLKVKRQSNEKYY